MRNGMPQDRQMTDNLRQPVSDPTMTKATAAVQTQTSASRVPMPERRVDRHCAAAVRLLVFPLRLVLLMAVASAAQALDALPRKHPFLKHPFLALDVVVEVREPYAWHSFGKLRDLMTTLKRTGLACKADTYERGVAIACGTGEERILIDLAAVPTRHPEALTVEEIRPRGPNGTPLPAREHIAFLNDLLRRQNHRP